jgi:hypothetical protein
MDKDFLQTKYRFSDGFLIYFRLTEAHFNKFLFVCDVGDSIMRHGLNLAAHFQFKT